MQGKPLIEVLFMPDKPHVSCRICGKPFTPDRDHRTICSPGCKKVARKTAKRGGGDSARLAGLRGIVVHVSPADYDRLVAEAKAEGSALKEYCRLGSLQRRMAIELATALKNLVVAVQALSNHGRVQAELEAAEDVLHRAKNGA